MFHSIPDFACVDIVHYSSRHRRCVTHQKIPGQFDAGCHTKPTGVKSFASCGAVPGRDVFVVVDACQGRVTNVEVRNFLDDGAMVLVTGSKFYQGPPFSGALLIPPELNTALAAATNNANNANCEALRLPAFMSEYFGSADLPPELTAWRAQLSTRANRGSAVRWLGALAEMEAYHNTGTEESRAAAVDAWLATVVERVAAAGGAAEVFEANGSIVNIQVRRGGSDGPLLSTGDLKKLHRWLTMDLHETLREAVSLDESALALACTPVFIGQPVEVAETFGVVRIALGAADVRALLEHSKDVTAQDEIVINKINLIARHFDVLLAAESIDY